MLKNLAVAALFLTATNLFADGTGADSQADVRKVLDGFTAAWNAHNLQQMASFWAEDGDLINPAGKWGMGRAGAEKVFSQEHGGMFKKSTIAFTIDKVRWLTPDLALVDSECTVNGALDKKGKMEKKPSHFHVVMVLTKMGGNLQVAAARPYALLGKIEHVK